MQMGLNYEKALSEAEEDHAEEIYRVDEATMEGWLEIKLPTRTFMVKNVNRALAVRDRGYYTSFYFQGVHDLGNQGVVAELVKTLKEMTGGHDG